MNWAGSAKARAAMAPRSSTQIHPSGRSGPISFGMSDHVDTGGKKSLSVMSSMNAVGCSTVSGRPRVRRYAAMVSLEFHDPIPVLVAPVPAEHNDSDVDRWPLVTALCRKLPDAA